MAYKEDEIETIFTEILRLIADENKALRNILKKEGMPSSQTFYKWLDESEDKSKQYARATSLRADNLFDEILDIADATANDIIIDSEGREVTNNNVIQRDRLRIDARKWHLSKLNPSKYGDKIETTIEGGNKPLSIISLGNGINPNETTS